MHALFFEVRPLPGHLKHYFEHVDRLRPVLAEHKGLVFLDRYAALDDPAVLLSHQLWESEEAIAAWRRDPVHRRSQAAGRRVHFEDYRIRVGARVILRGGDGSGDVLPVEDPQAQHVVAAYGTTRFMHPGFAVFESVNRAEAHVALATVNGHAEACALIDAVSSDATVQEVAAYAIRRDYGQYDRTQAPG